MSPEAREANEALAAALWENWLDDVRRARPQAKIADYVSAPVDRIAAANGDTARAALAAGLIDKIGRSEEHTSELQSLMRISYAVFCLKKKKTESNTSQQR